MFASSTYAFASVLALLGHGILHIQPILLISMILLMDHKILPGKPGQ